MASGRFVSYLRVSTDKQGETGLGIEAQRAAVQGYLNGGDWALMDEIVEVESGKRNDRPALDRALSLCRRKRAVLVVAKLDRLTRDTEFFLRLRREFVEHGIGVVFCDLPHIPPGPMGEFFLTQVASFGQLERGMISARTKAALAAAKARGTKLGGNRLTAAHLAVASASGRAVSAQVRSNKAARFAAEYLPIIEELRANGATTLRALASALNDLDERTPSGREGKKWSAVQVQRVLARAGEANTRKPVKAASGAPAALSVSSVAA